MRLCPAAILLTMATAPTMALHSQMPWPRAPRSLETQRSCASCASCPRVSAAPKAMASGQPPPSPPVSRTLVLGDAGAVLVYSLGLSTMRTFGIAFQEMLSPGFDLSSDLASMDLHLTVQYINIETLSACVLTLSWLVAATYAGACDTAWMGKARECGVAVALLRAWAFAAPLALFGKAVAVAAVMLPVGGWLAFDVPTAVADLGGMLAAVSLWRTLLLQTLL